MANYQPYLSNAGINVLHSTVVMDEYGELRDISLTGERPLTIYLDKREIVTLMTMGAQPELLTLGYLRNQGLVQSLADIVAIQVEWDVEAVAVTTKQTNPDLDQILSKRTVTSGCGQGTMFGNVIESLNELQLQCPSFNSASIYQVLDSLAEYNQMYKQAGAVHGAG